MNYVRNIVNWWIAFVCESDRYRRCWPLTAGSCKLTIEVVAVFSMTVVMRNIQTYIDSACFFFPICSIVILGCFVHSFGFVNIGQHLKSTYIVHKPHFCIISIHKNVQPKKKTHSQLTGRGCGWLFITFDIFQHLLPSKHCYKVGI